MNMPSYRFRLRFNFPEGHRIASDLSRLDLLVSSEETIRLVSGSETPIKDCDRLAVVGGPYNSEQQARTAADKSKRAFLYWAIEQRLGIDFGDGKQRSMWTDKGLAWLQKKSGHPWRNDIHGIDVYEHVDNLKFVTMNADVTVGKSTGTLQDTFKREYLSIRRLTEKQLLSSEIYASSFFDVSPRSRFITLVTAVEALLEPLEHDEKTQTLVDQLKAKTLDSSIDESTKNSLVGSLEHLRHQSISKAGRALAKRLFNDELFDGQPSEDFFNRCYECRSQILHTGTIIDGKEDTGRLANAIEGFVHRLLLTSLNSA